MSNCNNDHRYSAKTIFDLRFSATIISLASIAALSHLASSSEHILVDLAGTVRPLNNLLITTDATAAANFDKVRW